MSRTFPVFSPMTPVPWLLPFDEMLKILTVLPSPLSRHGRKSPGAAEGSCVFSDPLCQDLPWHIPCLSAKYRSGKNGWIPPGEHNHSGWKDAGFHGPTFPNSRDGP